MKKILILICIVMIAAVSKAQTPGFPSLDSLSKYNNHYINNAAVEAFANRRLNTLLHGIIWWIDTAMNRSLAMNGTDTVILIPSGHGNGNGGGKPSIRYNDTLYVYQVIKDTVWTAILLEAANGLYKTADSVKMGGPLIEETDINQQGNGISFHDGLFHHYAGDAINYTGAYNEIYSETNTLDIGGYDGGSNFYRILAHQNPLSAGGGSLILSADGESFAHSQVAIGGNTDLPGFLGLWSTTGNVQLQGIIDSAQPYQLYYNPINYKVTYALASGGGGGGGGGGALSVYGVNGITNRNDSTLELGGTLDKSTVINSATFPVSITGSVASNSFNVTNTHTTATAITGTGGTSGRGISGTGGSFGGYFTSVTGTGLFSQSQSGLAAIFSRSTAATNVQNQIATFNHTTSATPTTGFGAHVSINLQTTSGVVSGAGRFLAKWSNATAGSQASTIELWNANAGAERAVMSIAASGQLKLPIYTGTTFDGAVLKGLGVDASGNVLTYDVGSSGGGGSSTTEVDPVFFNGDGSTITPYTPDTAVLATHTYVNTVGSTLDARIDSLLNNFPTGALTTDIDAINARIDSLVANWCDSSSSTANEVNTMTSTIVATSDQDLPGEAILEYVLVKPSTSLAGFKVGTPTDDDKYVTATPVTAGTDFVVFAVNAHIPSTALTVRISGITSSTQIKLVYKTLHL